MRSAFGSLLLLVLIAPGVVCAPSECFPESDDQIFDRWPDGSPRTIVRLLATSPECQDTELVLFRVRNGGFTRLASWNEEPRRVELRDVTGNGVPEILVAQPPGRYARVVILHWDGAKLTEIGETSELAAYIDLDLDGVPEIVENSAHEDNECGARAGSAFVQRLRNGRFAEVRGPELGTVISLTKTESAREIRHVPLMLRDAEHRRVRIRVVNGTRGGKNRVTWMELRVQPFDSDDAPRGPVVRLPVHASAAGAFTAAEAELPSRCTMLYVAMEGPRGATATLLIETRPR